MESKRPRHRRKPVWRPLSRIGLPLRGDCHSRVHRAHRYPAPIPAQIPAPNPCPPPLLGAERSPGLSRFKLLSVDDLSPIEEATADSPRPLQDEEVSPELSRFKLLSVDDLSPIEEATADSFEEDYEDSFLEDGFGNLTQWRLSDLANRFAKLMEDKMNEAKTTEKKQSKQEKLKLHKDLMEQYMKASLKKYNNENLDEDFRFEFVRGVKESLIVEGGYKMYHHFNFEAMQPGSSISLFFAEVIPDKKNCEVTCCRLLGDDNHARCLGCNNQGDPDLKHPTSDDVYVGGHVDCQFPFLIDTDSEDDSD